jgi:Ca2+-binding EF-hand superfamily protein
VSDKLQFVVCLRRQQIDGLSDKLKFVGHFQRSNNMNRSRVLILSFVVIAGSATIASAQDHPPPPPPEFSGGGQRMMQFQFPTFADLDKNKDKKISKDEFPSQMPPQLFDRMDSNHDGSIDEEEWKTMTSQFTGGGRGGPGGQMIVAGPRMGETMTKLLDANADGKVSRDEFAKVVSLFDLLDKDHNGDLSQDELNGFFRAVNEAQTQATGGVEVNNLFEKYDKNKDGKITAEEIGNERIFKSLDLNKDGEVTRAEADTALKQIKKASDAKKASPAPNN